MDYNFDKKILGNQKTKPNKKIEEKGGVDLERRRFLKKAFVETGPKLAVGGVLLMAITKLRKFLKDRPEENSIQIPSEEDITELDELIKQNIKKSREKDSNQENKGMNLADYYLEAFEKLPAEFFPKDLFSDNLMIAQQMQESRFIRNAKSHAGAVGVMQNMPNSVTDVHNYLNTLKKEEGVYYEGPKKLPNEKLATIMNLIENGKTDYSRTFGKLYLSKLWHPKYGYKIGVENYKKGNIRKAQKELLASYNGGFSRIKNKPESRWPAESRDYYKKVFAYEEIVKNLRKEMQVNGVFLNQSCENAAVMLITKELEKYEKKQEKEKMIKKYIKRLKNNHGRISSYNDVENTIFPS